MTTSQHQTHVGVMYPIHYPPEHLCHFARTVEAAGFDELWLAEDCFLNGGVSTAAASLAGTSKLAVGLGIMPAVARNPVFAAMQIATLARMFPGRFLPGFGHGIAAWMEQIGALPESQLKALEEVTHSVRRLLRGESFDFSGRYVSLQDAQLVYPPQEVPPVSLGVIGPKSLVLSGRVADGTIIPEFSSPAYVQWTREQIDIGRQAAGRVDAHRLTVYTWCSVDPDAEVARRRARSALAPTLAGLSRRIRTQLAPSGMLTELEELLAAGGRSGLEANLPDRWLDQLGVIGHPDQCRPAMERLFEAGADSVVLFPLPGHEATFLDQVVEHVAPVLCRRMKGEDDV